MSTESKDWMARVPETDKEAVEALHFERSEGVGDSLAGIFAVRRKMGMSVLEAYEVALLAHLEALGKNG